MTKKDGGAAFPVQLDYSDRGMTLRDYFAGQALAGLCVDEKYGAGMDRPSREDQITKKCYAYADAMLREREK